MAKKDDEYIPTTLYRLRKLLTENVQPEDEDLTLVGGDIEAPPGMIKWWEKNKEWLLPWTVPKIYAARVNFYGSGTAITVTEYYNNTGFTFTWSYTVEGQPTVSPNVNISSNFTVNALAVGTDNENVTVGSYGPAGVMMEHRDSAGNLEDGEMFFEVRIWASQRN